MRGPLSLEAAAEPAEPGCDAADFADVGRGALSRACSDTVLKGSMVFPLEKNPIMDPVGREGCTTRCTSERVVATIEI